MSGSQQLAHLHLHTQYSLLDGVNKLPDVVKLAAEAGQPAIAITDHGNMHGAMQFYDACIDNQIKPIIGCEFYITAGSRFDRTSKQTGGAIINHLTVMAKNKVGYQNLCRLVSLAYKEGFYFKPRIDHEILEKYSAGLIVLSGCLASRVGELIKTQQEKELTRTIEWYSKIFKEDYFLEIQPHQIYEQQNQNKVLADYAQRLGLPMVATTDCHYPTADHHHAQEVLMCISTAKQITDPDRLKHDGLSLHLKSADEMLTEFADFKPAPEAVANTLLIADRCELEFTFGKFFMPKYDSEREITLEEELVEFAETGLEERIDFLKDLGQWQEGRRTEYEDRLKYELGVLNSMGFAGYFLVVADFINWSKKQNIPVGPGRGSAAGSLVAYCMRITELDPIIHDCLFERFLNPARKSMPDIDVDFCIHGRDAVIKYVVDKYGADRVAQISTFGTLKAKAAIKDVGRALGMSYAETDRIAKLVPPPRQGFDYPLAEALKMEPKLRQIADNEGKELIDLALKLEGLNRHCSTHAAGLVIGDRPLIEMLPMMVDKEGNDITQFAMKYVEKIGLVKFDFLGLKTLTVIDTAVKLIKESQDITILPNGLPLDDAKTYGMLCAGNTTGVFQLESSGITDMTVRLKPNCFNDLVAILALYRPGPLDAGMVDHYIERKHGREEIVYMVPQMEGILKNTYGIIVYQEQIMQLAQELGGYSLGEADLLRRAMGKKVPAEMAKQRKFFLAGANKLGLNEKISIEVFDQMETFARYGFNRSHSAAYALISYQTAFLRAHYPVEFMAALMSHEMGDSDKVLKNMTECRQNKIPVLPPSVNHSMSEFSVEDHQIRFGLNAVKGVGEKAVQSIVEQRVKDGAYLDFEDLIERTDLSAVNRRVLENLIKCGAFDFTKTNRAELLDRLEAALRFGQLMSKADHNPNQVSLFSAEQVSKTIPRLSSNRPEWPVNQKLQFERDALGFYLTGHPIEKFATYLRSMGAKKIIDIKSKSVSSAKIGGVVTALKLKNTKKGDRYASLSFEDMTSTIEALIWPDTYVKVSEVLASNDPVIATGKIDHQDDRSTFIIDDLESLVAVRDRKATQGVISLYPADQVENKKTELGRILYHNPGEIPLKAGITIGEQFVQFSLKDHQGNVMKVKPSEALSDDLEKLFGRPVLSFI